MRLITTLILVYATLVLAAQPKNTKRIVIINELTAEENFRHVGSLLISNGFEIESNKDFLTIRTLDRKIKGQNVFTNYSFVIKDKSVEVFGKYRARTPGLLIPDKEGVEIENRGMKGSQPNEAFEEMLATAKLIGTTLEFK